MLASFAFFWKRVNHYEQYEVKKACRQLNPKVYQEREEEEEKKPLKDRRKPRIGCFFLHSFKDFAFVVSSNDSPRFEALLKDAKGVSIT